MGWGEALGYYIFNDWRQETNQREQPNVNISEGRFIFAFASLPLEVARPI